MHSFWMAVQFDILEYLYFGLFRCLKMGILNKLFFCHRL